MIAAVKQMEAGRKAEDGAREVGVSADTMYAWQSKYGGMDVGEAQEAKRLRDENARLRKLVADLSLDKGALQSVIEKRMELAANRAPSDTLSPHGGPPSHRQAEGTSRPGPYRSSMQRRSALPKGPERIDWKLLTDLPIHSRQDAVEKLTWYAQRSKIETFHQDPEVRMQSGRCKASNGRTAGHLIAF